MRYSPIFILIIALISCKSRHDAILFQYQRAKNVLYGADSANQILDIYWHQTDSGTKHPVIILLHGGGWYTGDKSNFDDLNIYDIFLQNGYVVVNMNYRLAPMYKYPAPLDDIDTAIDLINTNSKLYNVDINRIYLLGRSAGGHLALQYSYTRNKKKQIKGVIDFFGITDLTAREELGIQLDTQIANFTGFPYFIASDIWRQSSPIFHVSSAIPTCIVQGTSDVTVFPIQSERLNDSLEMYKIAHKYIICDGATHALAIPLWQTSAHMACQWLRSH